MWFLQTDTLFLLSAACLLIAALRRASARIPLPMQWLMPAVQLAVLFYISAWLAAFYIAYTLAVWLLTAGLRRIRRGAGFCMLLACLLAVLPLFIVRLELLSLPFALVGFAFNMFKGIDALYYVYYGQQKLSFAVFVSYMLFLPVFTAGPVFRYREFSQNFENPSLLNAQTAQTGVLRIIRGLFKKVVLVNLITLLFTHLRGSDPHWYISLGITVLSYLILYLDLSGYSDVAIAMSAVCGFDAPENFKKPWLAPTYTQFWRSWHASVSDFIREHIYVIVARKKLNRWHSGLIGLAVMTVMALWHDFNALFLLAGLYNGVVLMLENFWGQTTVSRRKVSRPYFIARCILTNLLFALNTLVFTLPQEEILPVLRAFARL